MSYVKRLYLQIFTVWVAIFLVMFLAGELLFRLIGYKPGDISPNWLNFQPVDSLIVYNDFYVNQDAILVADTGFIEFKESGLNAQGFRCKAFDNRDTSLPSVMLIGDSFVWGMTAEPIDSSFPDILRTELNVEVYNMGIPAADPVQYALIAERYITELKPDIVLLYFFMGNDILFYDRIPEPQKNFYAYTNAGAILMQYQDREFNTAQEAYDFYVNEKYYLKEPEGFLQRLVASSALLSRVYSIRQRLKEKIAYEEGIKDFSLTNEYLLRVLYASVQNHAEFRIVIIPEIKEANMSYDRYVNRYESFFNNEILSKFITLPETQQSYFNPYPDAHLNNKGHRVYAEFTKGLLEKFDIE